MKNRKSFLKGALCGALAMLLAAGLVSCGLKVNSGSSDITSKTEDKISELQNLVKKHYMGDVKEKNLEDGIYKGYINGLNDPYSVYYNKKETKELYESTGGEYSGIGAVMSQNTETGVITLVQIYKDSPAEKAGLKDNDILYKVEGKEVTGKDLSKVVSKIKGEKGTTVELTVLRGENAKEVTVTATRDTVQAQTIEYKLMDDKIGYIRVSEFDTVTYDQYEEALDDLEKQGMTGLVVDLRNNPGGSLSTVCDMLDLMLPKLDGLSVCQQIREFSNVPIVMLTAKGEDMDKILGLEYGADDYITKPFNILEVKARIKAIMRRAARQEPKEEKAKVVQVKDLRIDCEGRRVFIGDREINLTAKEFDVLELLVFNPNKVYSRENLLNIVCGYEYPGDVRTVDVHIRRLREKIEKNPSEPKYVHTKWGVGYYFQA